MKTESSLQVAMKRTGSVMRSWVAVALLLVSQATYVALAADAATAEDNSDANEIQTEMPKNPFEIDSATKLLMWIQQNEGVVRSASVSPK